MSTSGCLKTLNFKSNGFKTIFWDPKTLFGMGISHRNFTGKQFLWLAETMCCLDQSLKGMNCSGGKAGCPSQITGMRTSAPTQIIRGNKRHTHATKMKLRRGKLDKVVECKPKPPLSYI